MRTLIFSLVLASATLATAQAPDVVPENMLTVKSIEIISDRTVVGATPKHDFRVNFNATLKEIKLAEDVNRTRGMALYISPENDAKKTLLDLLKSGGLEVKGGTWETGLIFVNLKETTTVQPEFVHKLVRHHAVRGIFQRSPKNVVKMAEGQKTKRVVGFLAKGIAPSGGWENPSLVTRKKINKDYLEFDFVANRPKGRAATLIEPMQAVLYIEVGPNIKGLRVYGANNSSVEKELN
jgi:hypothetical protein